MRATKILETAHPALGRREAAVWPPGMVEELPGFIPQVLRRDDVSVLRADETVFNAAGRLAIQALQPLHLERESATG
jgi:hypothetical protein